MAIPKLKKYFRQDPRIQKVHAWAKPKYYRANNPQHNWEHIIRDLYRALVIAQDFPQINYAVLIPAVVLHDLALTRKKKDYEKHGEQGSQMARKALPTFGFTAKEISAIAHCIASHKKEFGRQKSLEAKILYDADMLEKSGIAGIFASYRAQYEIGIPLQEWVEKRFNRHGYAQEFLYTQKARAMDQGGFAASLKHYRDVLRSFQKRKDWLVEEKDL